MMQALYLVALLVAGKLRLLENGMCVPFGEIKRTLIPLPFDLSLHQNTSSMIPPQSP